MSLVQEMQFVLTELKEQEPWLKNYHSKMLQMVVCRIDANRKALNSLKRNGHKVGKLNFVKREYYNSFTYHQSGFKIEKHGNTDLLWLSKIGYIQIRLHRKVRDIKQITVILKTNKWYALVCCKSAKPLFQFVNPGKSIAIDVGITKFAHDSDNGVIENPLFLKRMLKPLKRANRRLSRKLKNSRNRGKAKTKLQLLHERIHNRRTDFLHKVSTLYSREYDTIFLERLRVSDMVRNRHLSRNIIDSGWSTFARMLDYKSKLVIKVDPFSTSIDCSGCKNKVTKSLAVRIHRCNRCGIAIDRDYNASLNIKRKGLEKLLMGHEEVTPVEILCGSLKQERAIVQPIASSHKYVTGTIFT